MNALTGNLPIHVHIIQNPIKRVSDMLKGTHFMAMEPPRLFPYKYQQK